MGGLCDSIAPTALAHQRLIAERERAAHPRESITIPLDRFSVETITRAEATPLIVKYEWLGNVGRAAHFVGLYSPDRELIGVSCFGYGPAGKGMRKLLGGDAWCLERGACVPHAPKNAASFLIRHACHLIYRITGISRFFAYGDPYAGEYGAVYQAANWLYLGQGLDGGKGRALRLYYLQPGRDPRNPAHWQTSREFRRAKNKILDPVTGKLRGMTQAEAKKKRWKIAKREAKHVYAINIGRDARTWRKKIKSLPYPKPRPELCGQHSFLTLPTRALAPSLGAPSVLAVLPAPGPLFVRDGGSGS